MTTTLTITDDGILLQSNSVHLIDNRSRTKIAITPPTVELPPANATGTTTSAESPLGPPNTNGKQYWGFMEYDPNGVDLNPNLRYETADKQNALADEITAKGGMRWGTLLMPDGWYRSWAVSNQAGWGTLPEGATWVHQAPAYVAPPDPLEGQGDAPNPNDDLSGRR